MENDWTRELERLREDNRELKVKVEGLQLGISIAVDKLCQERKENEAVQG